MTSLVAGVTEPHSYQTYTEKLSRNAFFSDVVTGTEGFLLTGESAIKERSVDRLTTSSGRMKDSPRPFVSAGYGDVSLYPDILC